MKYRVIIHKNMDFLRTELYIVEEDGRGKVINIAQPLTLTFKPFVESTKAEPTMVFGEFGEDVFYAIQDAFIGKAKAEHKDIQALQAHLEDMRTIAYHKLGIKQEGGK